MFAKAVKIDNDNKLTATPQDHLVESDRAAGIWTTERFRRFTQRDDMFNRAFWDDDISRPEMIEFFESYRAVPVFRRGDGFTQKDFALRNAAWAVSDEFSSRSESEGIREGFNALLQPTVEPATTRVDVDDPGHGGRDKTCRETVWCRDRRHCAL